MPGLATVAAASTQEDVRDQDRGQSHKRIEVRAGARTPDHKQPTDGRLAADNRAHSTLFDRR
ncbi:hypothetical protein MCAG_00850 [Micromonospora sp. ATCC 39149]|nr:hypothetical protein MCAG_00850 [Micromonospora sp. ATCC 39149]